MPVIVTDFVFERDKFSLCVYLPLAVLPYNSEQLAALCFVLVRFMVKKDVEQGLLRRKEGKVPKLQYM